ncbi:ABC transporter substrate-binding protein, partial [Roseovarius sp. HI0049]
MTVRIGAGAGFSGDRIEPAVDLAERGALDFLVFECLAERTIALAQQAKLADPRAGYDTMLERRMRAVLPACVRAGTRIVTNMGAANPLAGAEAVRRVARDLGLTGLKVAAVTGDDVFDRIADLPLAETGCTAGALGERLVSANAYTGATGIVAALDAGAEVVICGRASDPALFLAPLVHSYGWAMDDWARLGRGTLVGHLLECAAQVTGGYFADPGVKDVPDLARIGFPLAEVDPDGNAVITKLAGTGGMVTRATCTEQLLYEIHDPAAYLQPDVVADFTGVSFEEIGPDRIAVTGGAGHPATGRLKVAAGYRDGWIGEGQISYAGPGCVARGRLAIEIVGARLAACNGEIDEHRGELIGH